MEILVKIVNNSNGLNYQRKDVNEMTEITVFFLIKCGFKLTKSI